MAHRPRGQILLLATLVLLCRCAIDWSPLSLAPDWRLSVEVAQVRASLGSAVATVRIRTVLSEIGHIDVIGTAR